MIINRSLLILLGGGLLAISISAVAGSGVTKSNCRVIGSNEIECTSHEEELPSFVGGNEKWCAWSDSVLNCHYSTKVECNHSLFGRMAGFLKTRKACVRNPDFEEEDE